MPPTVTPIRAQREPATDLWLDAADLRIHPDGDAYYSGDLISFQVFAHHGYAWGEAAAPDVDLEIWLGQPESGQLLTEERVLFYGQPQGEAWLEWAWDTTGLTGPQPLTVVLDPDDEIQIGDENPDNNVVTRTLELLPRAELPAQWAAAAWETRSSACCTFHYITGSAAERDIETLLAVADASVAYAGARVGEDTTQVKLDVYLINRVLGHGGFASGALILSYLDRFYPGGALPLVFRHEATHVLDQRFADVRPTLLGEGLAVYVSGGHFREEPLLARAAALLSLDLYIPLPDLADDFYPAQHEIGYLEAGAFVQYLVDRFGWDAFKAFYGDVEQSDAGQAAMMDAALQKHFGLTLEQAEADWLATLRALTPPPDQVADLRLTIDYYDTLRRYQRAWDPSAYFLQAWLPALETAEERGITADFVRHPAAQINVTLETMFVSADQAIDAGDYRQAEQLLAAINAVLDAGGDLSASSLSAEYTALVRAVARAGYQAQQISLGDGMARVLAARGASSDTVELVLSRQADTWWLMD